jgi:hypothetical protein
VDEPTQRCKKCGKIKPFSEFWRDSNMPGGFKIRCKECLIAQRNQRRAAEPDAVHAREQAYRRANPDVTRAARARYDATDNGQQKHREDSRKYRAAHPEKIREANREYADSIRAQVFAYYGRSCACCRSTDDLTIDHITGGGSSHRRSLFNGQDVGGWAFYCQLVNDGFPLGYQTLCRPCNLSKRDGSWCKLDHSPAGGHV